MAVGDTGASGIPGIEVPVNFGETGLSETEKAMIHFFKEMEKRTHALNDATEDLSGSLEQYARIAEESADRERESAAEIGKLLKAHEEEGKRILKVRLDQYRMSENPIYMQRLQRELLDWKKKKDLLLKQRDLANAIAKGDKESIFSLKEEMGILSRKEKVHQRISSQLVKEGAAAKDMLKGLAAGIPIVGAAVGGGAIITGIVEAVNHAVRSFMEWQREVVHLNEVFDGNKTLLAEAEKVIEGFGTQLGVARGELVALAKQGLQMKVVAYGGIAGFQDWTKETIKLHKATGLAIQSSGDLLHTVAFKFGVGVRGIREVAGAFTHVTKTSRISADELASYTKNLEGFFLQFPKMSGQAKADLTADMMGIAGAIADVAGDPQRAAEAFTKMRKNFDEQGWIMAAAIARPFGQTARDIKEQLARGDVEGVFEKLVVGLNMKAKEGSKALEAHAMALGDAMGLTYEEMLKWMKLGEKGAAGFKEYMAEMRKRAKDKEAFQKAAQDTTTAIDQMTNAARNALAQVWRQFGGELVNLAKDVLPVIVKKLIELVRWFRGPGSESISKFFKVVKDVGAYVYDIWVSNMKDLTDILGVVWGMLKQVTKTLEAFGLKGNKSLNFLNQGMMAILPGFGVIKGIAPVFRKIGEVIEWATPHLDKFRKMISDKVSPVVAWFKNIVDMVRDAFDDAVDAVENWLRTSPEIKGVVEMLGKAFGVVKDVVLELVACVKELLGLLVKVIGYAAKFSPLGMLVSGTKSLLGKNVDAPAIVDKVAGDWTKNVLIQAQGMDPKNAQSFVENALKILPRKEQRRVKADPAVRAVLEGKGVPKVTAAEAVPLAAKGDVERLPLYAETVEPPTVSPRINVQADPKLGQAIERQTGVLEDIRDLLGRSRGSIPIGAGTSLALGSMG